MAQSYWVEIKNFQQPIHPTTSGKIREQKSRSNFNYPLCILLFRFLPTKLTLFQVYELLNMERFRKRVKKEIPVQEPDELDDLYCHLCHKRYSREDHLLSHMKSVHGEKGECSICSKILSSPQALKRHMLTHSSDRSFDCTLCPKTFKRADTLRHHERTVHRDDRGIPEDLVPQEGTAIFIARQCQY